MRAILLAGALLVAAAAGTAQGAQDAAPPRRSAVVIRAGAPFTLGMGRGDVALRAACWKLAAGWSSDERSKTTRVAIAIARTCT